MPYSSSDDLDRSHVGVRIPLLRVVGASFSITSSSPLSLNQLAQVSQPGRMVMVTALLEDFGAMGMQLE